MLWFVALTIGVTWTLEIGLRPLGVPLALRAVIAMFVPALAALLVRGPLRHEGFADAGLRLTGRNGSRNAYAVAYSVVPACLATGALVSLGLHVQHVDPAGNFAALVAAAGGSANVSPSRLSPNMILLIGSIAALSVGLPINMVFAFGEEFGWRGYLLPRLAARFGNARAALIVGVIWGLWHAPLVLLDGFNYPQHRIVGVFGMIVLCVAESYIFTALRLKSGSIWPSTLAHAALNGQAGIVAIALAPMGALLGAPIGLCGLVAFAIAGRLSWNWFAKT